MRTHNTFDASRRRALLGLALLVPGGRALAAGAVAEALQRPALATRRPEQAVLLGAANPGARIVAVGERGLILVSDDAGRSWRQASSPVSVTLTALRFADARAGVAVGHGGTVLTTADGGERWAVRMDGRRAASLVVEAARAGTDPVALRNAERLVADGPDKPFFDVLVDGSSLVAVGAYGLILASRDGGASWESWGDRLDNPRGNHYYAIRRQGDTLLIAGEAGVVFCSEDGGKRFRRIDTPYKGSFFTAELGAGREMLVAGLRGNIWKSRDLGHSWSQLAAPMPASITASLVLADGRMLLANQAGFILALDGERLAPLNATPLPPLNGVLPAGEGLLALTLQGVMRVSLNTSDKAKS